MKKFFIFESSQSEQEYEIEQNQKENEELPPDLSTPELIMNKEISERKEKIKKSGFQEINLREDASEFSMELFFDISRYTHSKMTKFDKNLLKPGGFLLGFIFIYLCHLIFLPFLSLFLIFAGFKKGRFLISQGKTKIGLGCIFLYFLDSFLHLSYFLCFVCIFLSEDTLESYRNWNCLCFILYAVYLLIIVFASAQSTSSFLDFFKLEHLKFLGFRIINFCEKSLCKEEETKDEQIENTFKSLFRELNLDHSVFIYTTYGDRLKTNIKKNLNTQNILNPFINVLHLNASNRGSLILFDIYRHADEIIEKSRTFFWIFKNFMIVVAIVLLKIILPFYFITEIDINIDFNNMFCLFSVILFFTQMIISIYPLITSSDLKFKTFMLEKLISHIDISKNMIEMEIKHYFKDENVLLKMKNMASPTAKKYMKELAFSLGNNENIDQENEETIKSYLFDKIIESKIDTTCRISIETWDNCRKASHQFGGGKSELNETMMLFLGVYSFFLILILLAVIYDVYLVFNEDSAVYSGFMVSVFTIDLCLFLLLFLNRIYYGNLYNQTFLKEKRSIEILSNIYEDLYEFYDYYINDENLETDNIFYDILKKRLIERKKQVQNFELVDSSESLKKINKYLRDYIGSICRSLKNLQKNIEKDSQIYSHDFLGIFQSDFKNFLIQLGMIMVPIVPSIYSRYYGT